MCILKWAPAVIFLEVLRDQIPEQVVTAQYRFSNEFHF